MKSEGQIRHKLQQVTYRHLQRGIRTALSRRPENCAHNGCVRLPTGDVRFCSMKFTEDNTNIPCDEAFGGLDQAAKCWDFKCGNTKEEVKGDLTTFLKTSDVPTIAARYPDVAALLWTLDEDGGPPVVVSDEDPDPVVPPTVHTVLYLGDGGVTPYPVVYSTLSFHRAVILLQQSLASFRR